jgi:hypothetical protein
MRPDSRRKRFTAAKRATAGEANTMIEENELLIILFQEEANIMNCAHIPHNKNYIFPGKFLASRPTNNALECAEECPSTLKENRNGVYSLEDARSAVRNVA